MSTLYVIATPIGNLDDITLRACRVLGEVDVLACEDTRHTPRILDRHNIPRPARMVSYHEHNEDRAGERIAAMLDEGLVVGLCTNAGYPGVSDPGYRIVSAAAAKGHHIEVLPGAGAVEAALLASGLPTSSYTFKGFSPKKQGRRRQFLEMEREQPHSLVFFESPFRVGKFLAEAAEIYGDRRAAVCVELTKKFENVHRGFLSELTEAFRDRTVKGEVTVVIAGANPKFARSEEDEAEEGETPPGD